MALRQGLRDASRRHERERHPVPQQPGIAAPALDEDLLVLVLARDGHAIAFADSHGTWLQWLH
jgi:hypothetical protein